VVVTRLRRGRTKKTKIHPNRRKKKADVPKLTVFQKLFYGLLKHELEWTYDELLFHTPLDFTGYTGSTGMVSPTVDVPSYSKWQLHENRWSP